MMLWAWGFFQALQKYENRKFIEFVIKKIKKFCSLGRTFNRSSEVSYHNLIDSKIFLIESGKIIVHTSANMLLSAKNSGSDIGEL